MLGRLIKASDKLIKPYVESILKAFLCQLDPTPPPGHQKSEKDKDSQTTSPRVASCVLAALGELAVVGVDAMYPYTKKIIELVIQILRDQSATGTIVCHTSINHAAKRVAKREIALHTLGQLVRSTGFVIEPFMNEPHLLEILTNGITTERSPSIRTELLKVLGIIGAIDPYKYKVRFFKGPSLKFHSSYKIKPRKRRKLKALLILPLM